MSQFNHNLITTIIDRYGLEFDEYQVEQTVVTWLQEYDSAWIVKAIVESLHRGRYKVKSVDSILSGWQRAGKPSCKFTAEFEREILQNLPTIPEPLAEIPPIVDTDLDADEVNAESVAEPLPWSSAAEHTVLDRKYLNPEESAPFQHHRHSISAAQSTYRRVEVITALAARDNSAISQSSSLASSAAQGENSTNQIVSQPAKFQLFNTLRSIVDPNYQPLVKLPRIEVPQIYPEVTLPRISRFNLPLGNVSGGEY